MLITTKLISGLITAEVMLVQIVITIGQSIKNLMSLMFASFAINVATLRNTVTLMTNLQTSGQNFPKLTTTGLETVPIVDHETVINQKKLIKRRSTTLDHPRQKTYDSNLTTKGIL